MPPVPPWSERFLRHRRGWEIGLWVGFLAMQCAFNSVVVMMEVARAGGDPALWKPAVWEASSVLVLLALLPALLAFDRRFPLGAGHWQRNLPWHLLASIVYSVVHVVAMVALRQGVYRLVGEHYDFGDWASQWAYEYLKDVRTYFLSLAIVYGYRFIVLRLQGEASLLTTPDIGPPVEPVERPDRFLVRKLGREFLVAADDIEWLEADGNYVNLHVKGRLYPLRSTMTAVEPRLAPERFLRVHRSYIVNLDHLAEIEPLDTGDARLKLKDGTAIPCSRRYRAGLRARGGVELAAS